MKIEELKKCIEEKRFPETLQIFVTGKSDFLAHQYIHQISVDKKMKIKYVSELAELVSESAGFLDNLFELDSIRIYSIANLKDGQDVPKNAKNAIIICEKIDSNLVDNFIDNITIFPEINDICIKDYIHTQLPGLDNESIDWLIKVTDSNLYRIEQEIIRLNMVSPQQQQQLFEQMQQEGAYSDLTDLNIFNLSNAITKRDKAEVARILQNIQAMDVTDFYLLTTMHNALLKIISVQCNPKATPISLGMTDKQFKGIKYYSCNKYTNDELLDRLYFLNNLERKVKEGNLDTFDMVDIIITRLL